MIPNGRRLAGTVLLLTLVIVYVLFIAMPLAAAMLPNAGPVLQFVYYALAGLAWVPAAAFIISWMHKT